MAERYRVPKFKLPVEINTVAGGTETVHLFLGERAEDHAGPEQALDLLNGTGEFIVVEDSRGDVSFVRRDQLSIVRLERTGGEEGQAPERWPLSHLYTQEIVRPVLEDGSVLDGVIRYQLPEENRRVQDFLNAPERFIQLSRNGSVSFVNKHRIARVIPR